MLKIISIYYIIGLTLTVIICGKNINKDMDEGDSILKVFFRTLILGFQAPVLVVIGMVQGIKEIIDEIKDGKDSN